MGYNQAARGTPTVGVRIAEVAKPLADIAKPAVTINQPPYAIHFTRPQYRDGRQF